jgi:putative acetyltransferase
MVAQGATFSRTDDLDIDKADPRAPDVAALVETHLTYSHAGSPPEHVHALDMGGLLDPAVTLFSARVAGTLVGIGAIRELDPVHGEIKSMHTTPEARGRGVGRALIDHLLDVASARGYRRVSLETGTGESFAPARRLYERVGFSECPPFGAYTRNSLSTCMSITLDTGPVG